MDEFYFKNNNIECIEKQLIELSGTINLEKNNYLEIFNPQMAINETLDYYVQEYLKDSIIVGLDGNSNFVIFYFNKESSLKMGVYAVPMSVLEEEYMFYLEKDIISLINNSNALKLLHLL